MTGNKPFIQWRMGMGAWALVSIVIVVGVVCSIAVLAMLMLRPEHAVQGLKMPGEHRVTLPVPGYHILYFAFQRTEDRRGVIRPAGYDQMEFVLEGAGGKRINLVAAPESRDYVSRYTRGIPAHGFMVDTPGAYVLTGTYPDEFPEGQAVVLEIRQVQRNKIRNAFLGAFAVLLITALLAAALSYFGMHRFEATEATAGADTV